MHDIIPKLFDCWADPVAHLLLVKSSMVNLFIQRGRFVRMGDKGFDLFPLFVYFTQLSPSEGAFFATMAG